MIDDRIWPASLDFALFLRAVSSLPFFSPVPCPPTNLAVSVGCSQDSARFNWTTSIGSILYVVVAEDANGYSYSCNSMGTTCLMEGLRCGQNYTASIVGSNLQCNSSASAEIAFMTGRS